MGRLQGCKLSRGIQPASRQPHVSVYPDAASLTKPLQLALKVTQLHVEKVRPHPRTAAILLSLSVVLAPFLLHGVL